MKDHILFAGEWGVKRGGLCALLLTACCGFIEYFIVQARQLNFLISHYNCTSAFVEEHDSGRIPEPSQLSINCSNNTLPDIFSAQANQYALACVLHDTIFYFSAVVMVCATVFGLAKWWCLRQAVVTEPEPSPLSAVLLHHSYTSSSPTLFREQVTRSQTGAVRSVVQMNVR
jgi:hypothetical protein